MSERIRIKQSWQRENLLWAWVTDEFLSGFNDPPRWMGPAYRMPHIHCWLYVVWPFNYLVWFWRWVELRVWRFIDQPCRYDRDVIAAWGAGFEAGRKRAHREVDMSNVVEGARLASWNEGYSAAFAAIERQMTEHVRNG